MFTAAIKGCFELQIPFSVLFYVRYLRCTAFIFIVLLVLIADTTIHAQWINNAPNQLGQHTAWGQGGVMVYQSGKVWAGIQTTLWMSSDDGITWNNRTPFNFSSPGIFFDIDFFDGNTGIVSMDNGNILITFNAGLTWKDISPPPKRSAFAAKFISSAQEIVVGYNNTSVWITRDGGTTWTTQTFPSYDECGDIHTSRNGTITAMMNGLSKGSSIVFTTDYGSTWVTNSGPFDDDCKSFAIDPCDSNTIYVANEEFYNITDAMRSLYVSDDRGATWRIADSKPFEYLCGSVIALPNSIVYFQTMHDGVRRSTDGGQSWKTIGGPNGMKDSRIVTAKNSNILFAADEQGNIWKTINSGGDSLLTTSGNGMLSISQKILFIKDTLYICDNPVTRFINIKRSGNCPPHIIKVTVSGPQDLSYTTTAFAGDSLGINFLPQSGGTQSAYLILFLSDGKQDTVALQGTGIPPHLLSLATSDLSTDTLGGSVNVPITINGLDHDEDIDVVMHYDKELIYHGSYSTANVKLDITKETWAGRTKLHIPQAAVNTILGYARFDVFSDSLRKPQVIFDSVTVLTTVVPCQYTLPNPAISTISPPVGCGVNIISKFMSDSTIPQLRIHPNPASRDIFITSTLDLGEAELNIYDMLGAKRGTERFVLKKNTDHKLSPSLSDGIYYLRIKSMFGVQDLRIIVDR